MWVLIDKKSDCALYDSAGKEAEFILSKSDIVEIEIAGKHVGYRSSNSSFADAGCCIMCGISIDYDPLKPLCKTCHSSWNQYSKPDFKEHFYHNCGDDSNTSVGAPQCYECYQNNKKRRAI